MASERHPISQRRNCEAQQDRPLGPGAGRRRRARARRLLQQRRHDDDATEEPTSGSSTAIITANGSEPENPLLPADTNEVGGGEILDAIFAGLVYYDGDGKAVNDMAEEITVDDEDTLTVKLKEGQTFTDGEEVTADNFTEAWNYGAQLSNAQQNQSWFSDIEGFSADADSELTGLEVVDDYTFTINLTSPVAADFALRLGYSAYYPLPDVAFEDIEAFGEAPIGNGPYMLASEDAWQHDVQIDLVKNEDYQGGRAAQNGGLTFIFYATQDAAYADLLAGNVDVIDGVPPTALATFESDLGDRAVNQAAAIFQSFTIPQNLPHFSGEEGKLRRQAISHVDQPRRDHRDDLQRHPHAGLRLHVAGHRRLVGLDRGLRGPRVRRRQAPRSCGPRPTPSRRGAARSRSRTTRTAATSRGSTL